MPRRSSDAIPGLQHHRASGQARVLLNGHQVYLGRWTHPDLKKRYDDTIRAWLANDRRWPPPAADITSVVALANAYVKHCNTYYVKRGKPTKTGITADRVRVLLEHSPIAQTPALEMTRSRLAAFRDYLQAWTDPDPLGGNPIPHLARQTINSYVSIVVSMYTWWASECPDEITLQVKGVIDTLKTLRPLAKGRVVNPDLPAPRETPDVSPPPREVIEATIAKAGPMLAAMIQVQMLTAMRPSELCGLRACYIAPTPVEGVYAYHVPADWSKLDHFDIDRIVYLGPKAIELLRPWLPESPEDCIFDPRRSKALFLAGKRATRKTPLYPSHTSEARGKGSTPATRRPSSQFTRDSYARAIARACDRAFPHPELSQIPRRKLTPQQALELARWQSQHRWAPNVLRHVGATEIAARETLDIARRVLGHSSIDTTLIYARSAHDESAMLATLRHG